MIHSAGTFPKIRKTVTKCFILSYDDFTIPDEFFHFPSLPHLRSSYFPIQTHSFVHRNIKEGPPSLEITEKSSVAHPA
jgi:carbonic anhydrase